ncbi:MAG: ribonuclease H-like domain-containing protein [Candidatus Nanohaloarchaea archaeon]|nr:ribonuclease H-like domain-containing protein [Candidatus Nanohaloarchaea archaeon]
MLRNSFLLMEGIGKKSEQKLWRQGITTWNDFIDAEDIKGIGGSRNKEYTGLLKKALKNLEKENETFFSYRMPRKHHWRMYREFKDKVAYLDIETTGLNKERNKVTTVSVYNGSNAETLVHGKDLTLKNLQQMLGRHKVLVTYNGAQFDIPFLKAHFPQLDFEKPHIDLRYPCKSLGLTGGLKAIEEELGIARKGVEDLDGKDAIRLWKKYERGDREALDKLVRYNQLDVENLEPLLSTVYNKMEEKKFRSVVK